MNVAFVLLGFFFKARCLQQPWDGRHYARLCYNDIQPLFGGRLIAQDVFPYLDGALRGDGSLVGGAIEYPVLTGLFMWVAGLFVGDSSDSYLVVSALLLAPFGILVGYLLGKMRGERALLWAAAPALILYAFHNWDLLPVAASVAGFYAWHRKRPVAAAVCFGIGAGLKLFPLLFLGPLVLEQWQSGDRRGAIRSAGAGIGIVALINLPFAVAGPGGWFATYAFHRLRGPNFDSIWTWLQSWIPELSVSSINLWSGALTLASFAGALVAGRWRGARDHSYPFLQTCGALLAIFLLFSKVHSPQYTLWLLPFFVLLRVNVAWWTAYAVTDFVVYVAIFRRFAESDSTFWQQAVAGGVWVRAVLLAGLAVTFLCADAGPEAPDELRTGPAGTGSTRRSRAGPRRRRPTAPGAPPPART